ncbi:protein of unknown function [Fibrobacter sp. UWB15]|uniref:DUF4832 domain-containing protein n=1 Tax=unclassified Fibrobacter TaxID=2634177 RepID=UPI00091B2E96|nr:MULTISPECIES: DUF4832 domain-containing protein [unclassified Fibrobacter]PWJ63186.1 uncharacterized protein DUF4874 [Fibrobacter sp. UWB6]SHG42095.1 protein of unknown function [Fibrobacter sp. UWB8]SMG38576.1 protein of unknown function [Fibrobacter sp. UWB15]
MKKISVITRNVVRVALLGAFLFAPASLFAAGLVKQSIDTTDAMATLENFDRGFYTPQVLHLKPSGSKPIEKPYGKLLHLRAEISEFSSNAWLSIDTTGGKRDTVRGVSQDLTEDALNVLQQTFDNIRANKGFVIVRICYDPWYNGRSNVTPEHKWVLRHVEQLAPVLSKNTDVIVALEMGMHGAYGEMHSDTSITYDRVAEAVNLMLRNTPPELKILTRTGNYSAKVLGFDNWGVDFHIDGEKFAEIAKAKGDTMYRVGMFNDGYLGTQYDYGTWGADCATSICREEGVAWLEKYGINTPYGGEALTTAGGFEVINTPEFLAYEGFRTHTSYLNIQWNNNLIDGWKKSHFEGKDFEYDGSKIDSLTGFKYVNDHLGYRFVLRESWMSDTVGSDGILRAKLRIQNVGFGNLTWRAPVRLAVLEDLEGSDLDMCPDMDYVDLPDVDFRNVHSRTISIAGDDTVMTFDGNNEIEVSVKLGKLRYRNYQVYLKVGNIEFANDKPSGKGTCGLEQPAAYLGKIYYDENVKSSIPHAFPAAAQKKNAPFVQRERNSVIVRDGEKRYKANGATLR